VKTSVQTTFSKNTMIKLFRVIQILLVTSIVATGATGAAEPIATNEKDPLRATLMESKEKNKGVTLYTHGASIAMVVTALDERYVIGRNQQSTRIVIRIDHIDGVSAVF
jgi:hypothetical protein